MKEITLAILLVPCALAACAAQAPQPPACSWRSVLLDSAKKPVAGATVELSVTNPPPQVTEKLHFAATTDASGLFAFPDLPPGAYTAQVQGASGDTGIALVEAYDVP